MAEEAGLFDFAAVVGAVSEKMIRRHPHVFAGQPGIDSAQAQTVAWEEHKKKERAHKGSGSLLDDVPRALPALTRAVKLQKRAATVGFDWDSAPKVVEKIAEEAREIVEAQREIVEAQTAGADGTAAGVDAGPDRLTEELGDLLFAVANLARHLKVQPEDALRAANEKFTRRFRFIEQSLAASGKSPAAATLDEMEALWQAAKTSEK
jgi:MazG family protein